VGLSLADSVEDRHIADSEEEHSVRMPGAPGAGLLFSRTAIPLRANRLRFDLLEIE